MKQAHNTEMDLLLKRHARRASAGPPAGSESGNEAPDAASTPHLDADEMNAYAEGAILPQARSRYVAHLADCDTCRKIVSDLKLASDAAAAEASLRDHRPQAAPSRPWWKALAGLFAPPVLRYAIPALLLFGVIVVAMIATRNRKEEQFVAQNEQQPAKTTATTTNEGTQAPPVPAATPGESVGPAAAPPTTSGRGEAEPTSPGATLNDQPQGRASQTNANAVQGVPTQKQAPPPPSVSAVTPTDSPRRDDNRKSGQLDENLTRAQSPPAEVRATPVAGVEEKEVAKKERATQERKAPATSDRSEAAAGGRNKDREAENDASLAATTTAKQNEAPPVASKSGARRRSTAPGSSGDGARPNDNFGGSTETRSVGGHRFRRQGNAWVDTAYNSSRSTINVTRGSDQYRALVADEPGIGSIAEQLGGEVIVVWKGKAYRIR